MTQTELDALPETGGVGQETVEVGGKTIRRPVMESARAMFTKDCDGIFTDDNGVRWMTGWINGVRYKTKVS